MRPPNLPRPPESDAALAEAERRAGAGEIDAALAALAKGEARAPADPRLPVRRAELLEQAGRTQEAVAAWQQALALDPQQGMVLYRLGLACKIAGDPRSAIFYLEQAARRFGARSDLQKSARWEAFKLTFRAFEQSGLADGSSDRNIDTVAGFSREEFRLRDEKAVWWGRLNPRYADHLEKIRVRWKDPAGDVRREEAGEDLSSPIVRSELSIARSDAGMEGTWSVEALVDEDVVERRSFRILP